jgi:hypothetical protein
LPFLPLFDFASASPFPPTLDSSHFAAHDTVSFRVLGGKSGKIAARDGNEVARFGKVGGKSGNVWQGCRSIHVTKHVVAHGCGWRCSARYAVGKVPAA